MQDLPAILMRHPGQMTVLALNENDKFDVLPPKDLDAVLFAWKAANILRHFEDWNEEYGPVLWWRWPIQEPPWVGTPLDSDWPSRANYLHWTQIIVPSAVEP